MKTSSDLPPDNDYEAWLQEFDRRDLEAPDQRSMWALKYHGRLRVTLAALAGLPRGARVLEVGASQANASLLAGEAGLTAFALDRDCRPLRYALRKHTHGSFSAVCAEATALPFAGGSCAAVLALEILEHVPDPAAVLAEIRRVLAPGGLLVISTPNARYHGERLPSFSQRPQAQEALAAADGAGHLFAFTLPELRELVSAGGYRVLRGGYEGSVLMSDRLPLRRVLPPMVTIALSRLLGRLPGAAPLCYGCFLLARRED